MQKDVRVTDGERHAYFAAESAEKDLRVERVRDPRHRINSIAAKPAVLLNSSHESGNATSISAFPPEIGEGKHPIKCAAKAERQPDFTRRLGAIYDEAAVPQISGALAKVVASYAGKIARRRTGWDQRDIFLLTYGDTILGDAAPLRKLGEFLAVDASGLFSFVHVLPFYPSSSDDGFAVIDFRQVREDLGDWNDIAQLAESHRLVFDAVINHVSSSSEYMRGFSSGAAERANFFVELAPDTDTSSVLRTRNLPLLHAYPTNAGTKWLWTTFSRDQVDLNYANPVVLLEIIDVLLGYAERGASMIRLDAIPYLWKELGTSCAHLPQSHEMIKLIRDVFDAAAPDVLLLTETNVPHHENISYFGDAGDEAQMIYNFTLPPLILASIASGNASELTTWARGLEYIGPRATYLNITATHDGIGMRPTEGILSEATRAELISRARAHGGDITGRKNGDGTISPYELNINYFDALSGPHADESLDLQVNRFLLSQAIPMALMGVPGVYIHSLIGSRNDLAGVGRTGRARSINREQVGLNTLRDELSDPDSVRSKVFAEYSKMLRLRMMQSAFHPDAPQEIPDLSDAVFGVLRINRETGQHILALHNVTNRQITLPQIWRCRDLLGSEIPENEEIALSSYAVMWLEMIG